MILTTTRYSDSFDEYGGVVHTFYLPDNLHSSVYRKKKDLCRNSVRSKIPVTMIYDGVEKYSKATEYKLLISTTRILLIPLR